MKNNPLVACMLCLSLSLPFGASAKPFTDVFIFGDSLSDQGNIEVLTGGSIPGADFYNGRFSNGPVWADTLSQSLGVPITPLSAPIISPPYPPWTPGMGNNFAYGGARTNRHRYNYPLGMDSQVAAFLNGVTVADSDALYVVFAGANDIQDAIGVAYDDPAEVAAAMADPSGAIAAVQGAAQNIANAIVDLAAAGARSFLVPNGPNWALVPAVTEMEDSHPAALADFDDFAMEVSLAFNNQLAIELNALAGGNPALDIMPFDMYGLLQDMVNNPDTYGFTDVATSCYDGDDLGFTGGGTACANPGEFLFWDRIHPTSATHTIFANEVFAAIPEPTSLVLCLVGVSGFIARKRCLLRCS
jgi:phospholipase/lecithinase/hemolysin